MNDFLISIFIIILIIVDFPVPGGPVIIEQLNNIWDDLNTNSANLDGKIFKQISNDYIRNAYYRFKQSNEY